MSKNSFGMSKGGTLVGGENLGGDLIDSDTPGDRIRNRLRISSDHRHADTKPMKFGDGFTGFGPNLIFNCESSEKCMAKTGRSESTIGLLHYMQTCLQPA
jgi:hypothetical protein